MSSRRIRAAVAAVAIGALGALAGPSLTANAGTGTGTGTVTVHGDVHLGSTALGGYRVGFFDPADGSVITGTTAADGTFSLQVPSDVAGYAYAGTAPTAQRAISAYRGRNVVRGVVGLHQPSNVAGVIYQSLTPGLPAQLADGGTVHLRLQHSGRVSGTGNLPDGSEITVERLNGSRVGAAGADAHGSFTTPALVPGKYLLVFRGGTLLLAKSKTVTVVADRTVRTSVPHLVPGGVLRGTVRSGGKAVTHPVEVHLLVGGQLVAQTTTSSKGTYRFVRLAAGRYTVAIAENRAEEVDGGPDTQPTSDDYLHSIRHATIPAKLGTVTLNPTVAAAGHITGTGTTTTAAVVVERADGTVVRSVLPSTRAFTVGGLPTDSYVLWYLTKQGDLAHRTAAVVAGRTTKLGSVVPDATAPTVSGTVAGGPFPASRFTRGSGYVELLPKPAGYIGRDPGSQIAADGSFSIPRAVPGTYPAIVTVDHRAISSTTVTITPTTTHLDLQPGARTGTLDLRLTSHGRALLPGGAGGRLSPTTAQPDASDLTAVPVGLGGELAPGTYSFHNAVTAFDLDQQSPPAYDGPWWWVLPEDLLTVTSDTTTTVSEDLAIGH